MKINFKPLPEVQPSDDSDEDLPPVLEDPNSEKPRKNRLFDDPNPVDESETIKNKNDTEKEYTDLPKNTVAIPLGDMKAAGSGMTNNSLRKDFNLKILKICHFVKIKIFNFVHNLQNLITVIWSNGYSQCDLKGKRSCLKRRKILNLLKTKLVDSTDRTVTEIRVSTGFDF